MYLYMSKPTEDKFITMPLEIISKMLTPSEMRMLQNRWEILNLLIDGLSIRNVAKEVHVGTDTVMRTSRMLENEDLRNALVQLRRDPEIRQISQNPWVIGKSRDEE
jgi:Trp operon repressor